MQVDLRTQQDFVLCACTMLFSHSEVNRLCQEIGFTKGDGVFISAGKMSTVVV